MKFWIVNGQITVHSEIGRCMRYKRHKTKCILTESVNLPSERLEEIFAFKVDRVDLAGLPKLGKGGKGWIIQYTCCNVPRYASRAHHFSFYSKALLLSVRRFIARKDRPEIICSDIDKNFIGSENKEFLEKVSKIRLDSH
ncbi:hypothetical protein NPIL_488611 [Nephila pilipes]|uniref:Uncharacterized protein n=1 Tax=Nephila pilipes TaxID=299642 RepID=A0A8X6TMZ9_NEPPI|nr:hypothetical protein NPIL_488611 [Nephila pilipes]